MGFEYASNLVGVRLTIDIGDDIVERRRRESEQKLEVEEFNSAIFKA